MSLPAHRRLRFNPLAEAAGAGSGGGSGTGFGAGADAGEDARETRGRYSLVPSLARPSRLLAYSCRHVRLAHVAALQGVAHGPKNSLAEVSPGTPNVPVPLVDSQLAQVVVSDPAVVIVVAPLQAASPPKYTDPSAVTLGETSSMLAEKKALAVGASLIPSERIHGAPPTSNLDAALAPDDASSALYVPGSFAAVASFWQRLSAEPIPPPGVQLAAVVKARRPATGVTATCAVRSMPKQ